VVASSRARSRTVMLLSSQIADSQGVKRSLNGFASP
jgi:hypothetical protein